MSYINKIDRLELVFEKQILIDFFLFKDNDLICLKQHAMYIIMKLITIDNLKCRNFKLLIFCVFVAFK